MALSDRHTWFVAGMKVILPLLALGLLASLYLFSHHLDPSRAVRFAHVNVRELARKQGMGQARFAGTTDNGSAVRITADTAEPAPGNAQRILITGIAARIETRGGQTIRAVARQGMLNTRIKRLVLTGSAMLWTSTGYRIMSERLIADLGRTQFSSPGPVRGSGPPGKITAASMVIDQTAQGYVVVFNGQVKLVYQPKH